MIKRINEYLGLKLFVLLAVVIVMSIVPLAFMANRTIKEYGREMMDFNERHLRSRALSSLKELTSERASRYQNFFDRIASSSGMMASQASTIYSNLAYYAEQPLFDYQYSRQSRNGHWVNSMGDPVVSIYWGAAELTAPAKEELRALTHMGPLLQRALAEHPEILASHMITATGVGQYCTNNRIYKEIAFNLPPTTVFDLRQGEPFIIFNDRDKNANDVRWTSVYKDDVIEGLMLTASAPIYDNEGIFRGITGIDVPLDTISKEVLNYGKRNVDDPVLFSFLVDDRTRLIAFPVDYFPLFGLSVDYSDFKNSSDRLGVAFSDSTKKEVLSLAGKLIGHDNVIQEISHESERYYVITSKMTGLGWYFGTVLAEETLLSSVEKNRMTLAETIKEMEITGLTLTLVISGVVVAIVFLAVKHLVTPLRTLADATQRVAAGDLTVRCPVTTSDETGLLALSFNTMVQQLQVAQDKQLKRALDEKEVLLKEIYHRTKNNMMVIISMLDLQLTDIEDARIKTKILEMEDRIRAMALVHEKLYQSQNLSEISLDSYIREISGALVSNMIQGGRITLDIQVQSMACNIDYAIPLGLVINEIVTNSLKHAFPGDLPGTITIYLKRMQDGDVRLVVGDDGVGLPDEFKELENASFGMQIITSLVIMQLRGRIEVDQSDGTRYILTFPEPRSIKRV